MGPPQHVVAAATAKKAAYTRKPLPQPLPRRQRSRSFDDRAAAAPAYSSGARPGLRSGLPHPTHAAEYPEDRYPPRSNSPGFQEPPVPLRQRRGRRSRLPAPVQAEAPPRRVALPQAGGRRRAEALSPEFSPGPGGRSLTPAHAHRVPPPHGGEPYSQDGRSRSRSFSRQPGDSIPPERGSLRIVGPPSASSRSSSGSFAEDDRRRRKKARKREALQALYLQSMWQQAMMANQPNMMSAMMGGQPGGAPFSFPGYSWPMGNAGVGVRGRDLGNSLEVPRRLMARVIGKKGSTINQIREESGCRIDIEDKDDDVCVIQFSGNDEQVERAKAMIREVMEKAAGVGGDAPSGGYPFPGFGGFGAPGRSRSRSRGRGRRGDSPDFKGLEHKGPVESIKVQQSCMGRIIGRQGANINRIRRNSGAIITVDKESEDMSIVKMSGPEEAVEMAKKEILETIERAEREQDEGPREAKGDAGEDEKAGKTLEYPASIIGGIIGVKGVKIKEVRANTGARVRVERVGDHTEIKISGKDDQIERAEAAVRALAEEALSANALISEDHKAGDQAKHDSDEDKEKEVADYGAGDDVKAARPEDQAVSEVLELPTSAFGSIVGNRGAKVQEVRMHSGARVQVDKFEDKDCTRVQISGRPDQVQSAKEMITSLVEEGSSGARGSRGERKGRGKGGKDSDHEQVTIQIPKSVLGRVIGRGGTNIKMVQMDSGARCFVSSQDGDPCPLKISGSRENIRKAKTMFAELVADTGVEIPDLRGFGPAVGGPGAGFHPDQGGYGAFPQMGGYGGPMAGYPPMGGYPPYGMPGPWSADPPPGVVRGRSPSPLKELMDRRPRNAPPQAPAGAKGGDIDLEDL